MPCEEPFRFQRGHAACSCRCHSLTVDFILYVACGEYPFDIRLGGARPGNDIFIFIKRKLTLKDLGVWRMANSHKRTVGFLLAHHTRLKVLQAYGGEVVGFLGA